MPQRSHQRLVLLKTRIHSITERVKARQCKIGQGQRKQKKMFLPLFGLLLATSDLPTGYPTVPIRGVSGKPVRMPMIGLGTWLYPDAVAQSAVTTAFSLGYRHVDTAFGYKNQGGVGQGPHRPPFRRVYHWTRGAP